ncbi:hypothetical protein VL3_2442 [Saccharomyces cerevisiae VL3]|uniref:Uncharacterized protein n=1 Tax=Saccharomyces cerevisiae x Saccharomyces kudriavzevii (strain VIN7) TaxID=1095631 RepID=H0GI51_SACCK|nr:hypothetical protein VIN13_2430 [Saccharomyces cerevisiae Vin13]EGA86342.1 hypothetical protein VL3_2442 [Saccharomyces cerevisiae VL3]EHN06529.1 hypothetical protein VIN7_2483 [Saccharomyces cerevisiae x Saccharomyces kudriavzevii VIN7]
MLLYSNSGSELNTVKPCVRRRMSRKKKLLVLKEIGLLELLLPRSNLTCLSFMNTSGFFINGFSHISSGHTENLLVLTDDTSCLKFIYPSYHWESELFFDVKDQ